MFTLHYSLLSVQLNMSKQENTLLLKNAKAITIITPKITLSKITDHHNDIIIMKNLEIL